MPPPIVLKAFKGEVPRFSSRLLPPNTAQVAKNCDLRAGTIKPLKTISQITKLTKAGALRSIHKLGSIWLSWAPIVDVITSDIYNADRRIFFTGDGYAKQTTSNLAGGADPALFPTATRRMGCVGPAAALTLSPTAPTTPSELVTNGTFASDSGWTKGAGWTIAGLVASKAAPDVTSISQAIASIADDTYTVVFTITRSAGTLTPRIGTSVGAAVSASGTHTQLIKANATNANLEFWADAAFVGTLDTVSVISTEAAAILDSVAYYYTYVTNWSDGLQEESKPSPITAVFDMRAGAYMKLTGMTKPLLATNGNDVAYFRFYRTVTGLSGVADMQLIHVSSGTAGAPSGALATDIVAADGLYIWDCDSVSAPTGLNQNFGEICPTDEWVENHGTLTGIIQGINGTNAAFYGNKLFVSSPSYPYAMIHSKDLPYEIVAIAAVDQYLIALTTTFPYIFTGADPRALSRVKVNEPQANISKRGTVSTKGGVIYPTPDGLFILGSGARELLTEGIYRRDQWLALTPANLISFYHDEQYIGFFSGTNRGLIFNFKENPYVIEFELSSNYKIYGGMRDEEGDALYLLTQHVDDSFYYVEQFEGSSSNMSSTWTSGNIMIPGFSNIAWGMIDADYSGGAIVMFKLYGDGELLDTIAVTSKEPFRLNSETRCEIYYVELTTSTAEIFTVKLSHSSEELLQG